VENENQIDKVTALTGSGPAYFIHFLEAIIQTFKNFGFSENKAETYAKELFYGTAITCMNENKNLKKTKDSVISKGGTTDAALKTLDALKFKSILTKSIKEAYNKAQQLGKNK
jgi:pyrroline-5-carboxylate reductase